MDEPTGQTVDLAAYAETGEVKAPDGPSTEGSGASSPPPDLDAKRAAAEEWAQLLANIAAPLAAPGREDEFAELYRKRVTAAFLAFDISTALPGAAVALDTLPAWVRALGCAAAAVGVGVWTRADLEKGVGA